MVNLTPNNFSHHNNANMLGSPALLPSVITATILAIALAPGFILTLPPLPQNAAGSLTWDQRIFRTGVVTPWSVAVHAVIFLLAYGVLEYFILQKYQQ